MRKKWKIAAFAAACGMATCVAAFAVACVPHYNPKTDIPGIVGNPVMNIEKNELSFALGMDVDQSDLIVRCGCSLTDDEGHEVPVTKKHLTDGVVKFTEFELDTVGSNKMVSVSYKKAVNYIFYDVTEYAFELSVDGESAWKSGTASAEFDSNLDLAVRVNLNDYNYSIDAEARQNDAYHAERFNGWYTESGEPATGNYRLDVSSDAKSTIKLHAEYLSDAQYKDLKLSYDIRGRRVFSGYKGKATDLVTVPEGVTYIDLDSIFSATPDATSINFKGLDLPSTAYADLPFQTALNTRGLERIDVDDGNPYYSSFEGALYSKDLKTLYLMPSSCEPNDFPEQVEAFEKFSCAYWEVKIFALPDSVQMLYEYCFAYSELTQVIGIDHVENVMSGVLWGSRVPMIHENGGYYTELAGKYMLSSVDKDVENFTLKQGTVGIAGYAFSECKRLISVDLGNELESIGEYAFLNCSELVNITLPASVNFVGECAFYGCSKLERVENMENVVFSPNEELMYTVPSYLFGECSSLNYVELPDEVEAIGSYAFYKCSVLETLNLKNVKEIGTCAFYYSGITSITLPESLESLGSSAFRATNLASVDFSNCTKITELPSRCFQESALTSVVIPENITEIGGYCFYLIKTLTSVELVNVETIDQYAFSQCTKLKSVSFGNALKTIGLRAFSSDSALTEIVLPDSVETVGGYAFASTAKLVKFTIGAGVQTFGNHAFAEDGETFDVVEPVLFLASSLKEIIVSSENTYFKVKNGALYGKSVCGNDYGDYGVLYCMSSAVEGSAEFSDEPNTQIVLPYSFQVQKTITDVTFGDGLVNIGKGAFYMASSLERVYVPGTIAHVGANIFLNCVNNVEFILTGSNDKFYQENGITYSGTTVIFANHASGVVRIKEGTTAIDTGAFMNNSAITEIYIPDSVTRIEDKAFENCSSLEVINIGSGLTTLNGTPFKLLASLRSIVVSPDNTAFKTDSNDILYSIDGKTLVLCPAANGMIDVSDMLDTVEDIGAYAFSCHQTLKNLILPEGVKTIADYAFYECRALEKFYASYSLKTIGKYAFSFKTSIDPSNKQETRYCNTLKTVLLRDGIDTIDAYAFYGQYGIQQLFCEMTAAQAAEFWSRSNTTNISYLRRGCPKGDGTYYNKEDGSEISRYLFSRVEPQITLADYEWFYFDEDGNPVLWPSSEVNGEETQLA